METIEKNSCEHEQRLGNRFCPVCGVKVFSSIVEIGEIMVDSCSLYKANHNSDSGIFGMRLELDVLEGKCYGDFASLNSGAIRVDKNVDEKIEYLKEKLQEAGLPAHNLGVYVVSEVSY